MRRYGVGLDAGGGGGRLRGRCCGRSGFGGDGSGTGLCLKLTHGFEAYRLGFHVAVGLACGRQGLVACSLFRIRKNALLGTSALRVSG